MQNLQNQVKQQEQQIKQLQQQQQANAAPAAESGKDRGDKGGGKGGKGKKGEGGGKGKGSGNGERGRSPEKSILTKEESAAYEAARQKRNPDTNKRICVWIWTREGCPFGKDCTYTHDKGSARLDKAQFDAVIKVTKDRRARSKSNESGGKGKGKSKDKAPAAPAGPGNLCPNEGPTGGSACKEAKCTHVHRHPGSLGPNRTGPAAKVAAVVDGGAGGSPES